jgi:ComF family protein
LIYGEVSKQLILQFKHGGRADSVPVFANWMVQAGKEILGPEAILVPVPLHLWRRVSRKFNQSALLAGAMARQTGIQHQPLLLHRHRHTPPQGFKSGASRKRNVRGAFTVPNSQRQKIRGQHLVLIDDVRTSGATLNACARALLGAGAAQVDAVTLARVVKPVEVAT